MQQRDPKTGERRSVHPDISRWLQVLREDRAREQAALAAGEATERANAARDALAEAEAALAAHEFSRLLAARDTARDELAEAQRIAERARHGTVAEPPKAPSGFDRRRWERLAREAGWHEEWKKANG